MDSLRSPLTPDVRQRRQSAVAPLRSRANLRLLRVVRPSRVGPRPALPASPSGAPRHASPSSAPFPPVLHGGSAAPPASPPRGPFLIPSRHSSRLCRHLSVCRRPWLPARPPLLASARLFKTPTSARRPCRAGILASTPIPLPNPGVQRTSLRFARSPLTPTVRQRRQCAATLLRSRATRNLLPVVRPPRTGPPPRPPASTLEPPRHASPFSAPFPPVLHGGSAAPPASPPRGPFLIASRHSSRLYRHLSVCRRPWFPARPPLLASPRLFTIPTSAWRPCRAGILASNPIPLPNPGVQRTRFARR